MRGQSRTGWISVSTGMFTSFLFEGSFGVVDLAQNTMHALGSWDNAVTVTAPDDIGRLTAAILFAGLLRGGVFQLPLFRAPEGVESNNLRHDALLLEVSGCS